jgi:hypothetical protein
MVILVIVGLCLLFFFIVAHGNNKKSSQNVSRPEADHEERKGGLDPNYKTLYVNPDKKYQSNVWIGNEIMESLKLKDDKEHKFELNKVFIDGAISGHSLATRRDRYINQEIFVSLDWKGKSFKSLLDFSKEFEIESRSLPKAIISFDYTNNEGIVSSRDLDIERSTTNSQQTISKVLIRKGMKIGFSILTE